MDIAIITGASSGMGKEFVIQADTRYNFDEIWVIARRKERLEELAKEAFTSYHATYPEIQHAWKKTIDEIKANKCLYNYMGRRMYFLEPITENNMDSIIAFKPQSTIGDYVASIIADACCL